VAGRGLHLLVHELLHQVGEPSRRVWACNAMGCERRMIEHVRRSQQRGQALAQGIRREIALRDQRRTARLDERSRVGRLMIVDRAGQRHKDRRSADDSEFSDGRCTGTRDNQMRGSEFVGYVREKW
jgi:hypothetical protein